MSKIIEFKKPSKTSGMFTSLKSFLGKIGWLKATLGVLSTGLVVTAVATKIGEGASIALALHVGFYAALVALFISALTYMFVASAIW